MKVWGKEVKYCRECNYCSDGNVCSYTGDELQFPFEEVHRDCPFSKPITKEVIESFGFIVHPNGGFYKDMYRLFFLGKEQRMLLIYKNIDESSKDIHDINKLIFKGFNIVNNPKELRFILTSLGIIQ